MSAAGQTTFAVDADAFLNYLLKLNNGQLVGNCALIFKLKYQIIFTHVRVCEWRVQQQQQQTT